MLKKIATILLFACFLSGCGQVRETLKRPLEGEGELYIFSEPFPQEAMRLMFSIESVSAIDENGQAVPLKLRLSHFSPEEVPRQRLFAQGKLPPGKYRGIAVKAREASLTGEEGRGRLLVAEHPYVNKANFTINGGKASTLAMDLNYRDALAEGMTFSPVFAFTALPLPLTGLTGYVTNRGDNAITVFDKRSTRVGAMIATGANPAGIALDQSRMLAYVALSGEDSVGVLDARQNEFTDRIRLNSGDRPHIIAITRDGKVAITANSGSNSASIIDLVARTEIARIKTGNGPEYVLISRNDQRAYVFNRLEASITVIDLASRTISGEIKTESAPIFGQLSLRDDRLYVFHELSPNMLVIPLDGRTMTRRVYVGMGARALKIHPLTDLVYVGGNFGGVVDVYDPYTLNRMYFLDADGAAGYLAMDGEENNLLVIHPKSRTVRSINLVGKKQRGLLDTGVDPYCMAIFGER